MNKSINCIFLQNFFIKALTLLSFHHTQKNLSQFFFSFCRNQKLSGIRFRVSFFKLRHLQASLESLLASYVVLQIGPFDRLPSNCPRFPAVLFLFIYFHFLLSVKSHKGGDFDLCELFQRIYHFLTALQRFAFVKPIEKSIFLISLSDSFVVGKYYV